ncbi:MAG: hypothetical protein R6V08_07775 [Desulfuromonadales bacterium]
MKKENVRTNPLEGSRYVSSALVVLGIIAFSAGTYVAWPALVHLGSKIV